MLPGIRSLTWAALLSGSLVGGCKHPTGTEAYPKDPLLLTKKPVEGSIEPSAPPVLLAAAEPLAPSTPPAALAVLSAPNMRSTPSHDTFAIGRGEVSAQPAIRERGTAPISTAVRSAPTPPGVAAYGHAPDHSWLLGVLDKHYQGHFDLRFCDASEENKLGGKVTLEPDPQLAQFQDGDVVRVEGELVPMGAEQRGTWSHYPRFRVKDVKLVERKK